jgi:hypothetical protein
LYPDVPSLNSPFGTGNNTFGLDSQYKRFASVCRSHPSEASVLLDLETHYYCTVGDFIFEWHRRAFSQYMSRKAKVPVYAYQFSDPDAKLAGIGDIAAPGSLGGEPSFISLHCEVEFFP